MLQSPCNSSKFFEMRVQSRKLFLEILLEDRLLSLSPYSFRMGSQFLARGDLENVMTSVFFQDEVLFSIWYTTLPIFVVSSADWDSEFVCGVVLVSH